MDTHDTMDLSYRGKEAPYVNLVIAFDLGTTHLKWIAIDPASGRRVLDGQIAAGTVTRGIRSEQNPQAIWSQVQTVLEQASQSARISRISFSAAMHSFLVVTPEGEPVTRSWTWIDKRSLATAKSLRLDKLSSLLRKDTGVPVHAMSPLVKWLYIRQAMGQCRPVTLKDYLVFRLTGQWVTDYSTAATTGFLGVDGVWLPRALELSGLRVDQLPTLHDMAWTLPASEYDGEVVLGANDAACAHLHLKIPQDGSIGVLAMGTSGALRTTWQHPTDNEELFSYMLGPTRGHLVGSAFSNVGNILVWLAGVFSMDIDAVIAEGIGAIRRRDALPLALPYWFGERSPWWRDDLSGAWLNIAPQHGRAQLIGSALLSMTASFWHGLKALEHIGAPLTELRGGSGLLENSSLAQWMADALGHDLVLHDSEDASLLGALNLAGGYPQEPVGPRAHYAPHDGSLQSLLEDTWHRIDETINESHR